MIEATDALWPCPNTNDEFADARCREERPVKRRELLRGTFVAAAPVRVGRFDFRHRSFPLTVFGLVITPPGPDGGGGELTRLVVSNPPRNIGSINGCDDLPASWVVGRTSVSFADAAAAEEWRNASRSESSADDSLPPNCRPGEFSTVFAFLYFRIVGTFRVTAPPSRFEVFFHRALQRGMGQLGVPASTVPAVRGATIEGVRIRPLGWAVVGDSGPRRGGSVVLATRVLAGSTSERRVVAEAIAEAEAPAGIEALLRADGGTSPTGESDAGAASGDDEDDGAQANALPQPNRQQIQHAMGSVAGAVRACAPAGQTGMVMLRISFVSNGSVSSAAVASGPFAGTPAAACMENAARAARVPAFTSASVTLSYPIMVQAPDPALGL